MNVLLKGHVTISASIIQALLNVFAMKDTFFLASHIVAVSAYKRIAGIFYGILFLCSQHGNVHFKPRAADFSDYLPFCFSSGLK